MAIYAGETVRISTTALNFDQNTPLTDADVSDTNIKIYNRDLELLIDETMDYNSDRLEWFYDWDTGDGIDPPPPGTYFARLTLFGSAVPFETFEIKRIRLARPKV